jgi:hypothetical protein
VSGLVTAVSGKTLTVASVGFARRTASSSPSASPSTTPVTVATTSTTTWTRTVAASGKALAVGQCVTAVGEADSTGAVTATAITSRAATDGTCESAFGGGGQPRSQ